MTDEPRVPQPSEEAVTPSKSVLPGRNRPVWPWIAGGIGVIVVAAAIIVPVAIGAAQRADAERQAAAAAAAAAAAEEVRLGAFNEQLGRCVANRSGVAVLDGGEALELRRVTKYDGISYAEMECVLKGLGAPAVIESEIGQTRSLDGRQTDEWDGYEISWSYHPDSGASIVIKHAK